MTATSNNAVVADSFAFSSSKGGAGKSTLVFNMAAQYALDHPDLNVLVMDMSIFGDVSALMLGGTRFKDDALVDAGRLRMRAIMDSQPEKSSASLMRAMFRYQESNASYSWWTASFFPPQNRFKFEDYCVSLNDHNEENRGLPGNLFLSIGNRDLESVVTNMAQWNTAIQSLHKSMNSPVSAGEKRWVVFFDTDHDCASAHCKLAFASAEKLIIPMSTNPNDYARLCRDDHCLFPTISQLAEMQCLRAKIHLVVFNRVNFTGGKVKDDVERGIFSPVGLPEPERVVMSTIGQHMRNHFNVPMAFRDGDVTPPVLRDFNQRYFAIVPALAPNVLKRSEETGTPICCFTREDCKDKDLNKDSVANAQEYIREVTGRL